MISQALAILLGNLLPKSVDGSINPNAIKETWFHVENLITSSRTRIALEVLNEYRLTGEFKRNAGECQQRISALIPLKNIIAETPEENWATQVEEKICKQVDLNEAEIMTLVQLGVRWYLPKVQASKMYTRYFTYKKVADK